MYRKSGPADGLWIGEHHGWDDLVGYGGPYLFRMPGFAILARYELGSNNYDQKSEKVVFRIGGVYLKTLQPKHLPESRWDYYIEITWWLIILLLGVLPVIRVVLILRAWSRRRKAGFCVKCGYDLRATPDRCPECGTPRPTRGNRNGDACAGQSR